jgi:hypothetical protein
MEFEHAEPRGRVIQRLSHLEYLDTLVDDIWDSIDPGLLICQIAATRGDWSMEVGMCVEFTLHHERKRGRGEIVQKEGGLSSEIHIRWSRYHA